VGVILVEKKERKGKKEKNGAKKAIRQGSRDRVNFSNMIHKD